MARGATVSKKLRALSCPELFALSELVFGHRLAVDAAIDALLPVREAEGVRQLLLHRGDAPRVLAVDDVCHRLRQLEVEAVDLHPVAYDIDRYAGGLENFMAEFSSILSREIDDTAIKAEMAGE